MFTVAAAVEHLERFAPPSLAAEWDNVGLLLGDRAATVERVMTCLTATPESAAEAVERRADLIVTHHPILFQAIRRLTTDTPEGRMLWSLARAGVAVYSPHTAFDNTRGGINDQLAAALGLSEVEPLRRGQGPRQVKLVVFVPDSDLAKVSDAMFAAGAGRIGEYSECSFRIKGSGSFFGSDASNPTLGQKGRREEVSEWRLEVVCPEAKVAEVVATMRRAHSYEEPAFDVVPLTPAPSSLGEGRVGVLPAAMPLQALALRVKQELGCGPVQVVGERSRAVSRVAIVCGAGGELLREATRARADVFLTGEARFHDLLAARAAGVALILPGHHATERPGVEALARQLQAAWPEVQVWASERERDPAEFV